MLLGVEIPHQHALAKHLVQEVVLRRPRHAVLAERRPLVGQPEQRGVRRVEQQHRLVLGRQAGEEGQGREDGVLKDLGQPRVVQRLVGEFGEELGQVEQTVVADDAGRVVDEGEQDGDEEGPVFGDELGLGGCGMELALFVLVCGFVEHIRDTPLW